MKLLLIEDEIGLSDALCQSFRNEKYIVESRYDGETGLNEALTGIYDAIILDVMLPKMDGFQVLVELRASKIHTPVLMLTAKSDLSSRIEGLDLGADYYLTKPFEIEELMACIRAITRRPDTIQDEEPQFGDLILKSRQSGLSCKKNGQFVKLGAKELLLMEILIQNRGNILSKETLIERIWGMENDSEYNNIEVYVSFVRKKLAFIESTVTIKSTRGVGYSLEDSL